MPNCVYSKIDTFLHKLERACTKKGKRKKDDASVNI